MKSMLIWWNVAYPETLTIRIMSDARTFE